MASKTGKRGRKGAVPPKLAAIVFRTLDYITDGIAIGSVDGTIYYCNKAWFDMHAWDPAVDLRGKKIQDVERDEFKPILEKVMEELKRRGKCECRVAVDRPDGSHADVSLGTWIITDFDPPVCVAILRPVTDLVQAQNEVVRRNRELAAINEIHHVMLDASDRTTVVRKMLNLLGDFVGAAAAGIYEVDRSKNFMELIDCCGLPASARAKIERIPLSNETIRKMLDSRIPVVLEEDLPEHRGDRSDIRSAMGFKRIVGITFRTGARRDYHVVFALKKDENVCPDVRRFLEIASAQIGIALDRVAMSQKLAEREREIEQRAGEIAMFAKLHNEMISSNNHAVVVRRMFDAFKKQVGARTMGLYRIDRAADQAVLVDCIGVPVRMARRVESMSLKETAFAKMLEAKGTIVIEEDLPGFCGGSPEKRKQLGIKCIIGFLFRPGDDAEFLAVLGLKSKRRITPDLRRFFESVGRHFAIAIERLDFIEKLRARESELHALTGRLLRAGEEERRLCALRLHDEFGQMLAGLNLELSLLERKLHGVLPHAKGSFRGMRFRIKTIADSMRSLSKALHPAVLEELGLLPALEWYVREFKQATGIKVQIKSAGFDEELPREVSIALYRIAQECLANVRKHAHASFVKITLAKGYPYAIMRIEDNGKGFSPAGKTPRKKGLGLVSMREQVELLKGTFLVSAAPGKGTRVRAKIPIGECYD